MFPILGVYETGETGLRHSNKHNQIRVKNGRFKEAETILNQGLYKGRPLHANYITIRLELKE